MPHPLEQSDIEACRLIHKRYGPNYYPATRLMPAGIRDAIHVLYAWVRLPDEIVDNPDTTTEAKTLELAEWRSHWQAVFAGADTDDPVMRAARAVFGKHNITASDQDDFLAAMEQDLTQDRYQNYSELQHYMYGSAGIVGVMCSKIIGYTGGQATLDNAKRNGDAMQLTNFLRDVGEDWRDRARIYLPLDELHNHGLTEGIIAAGAWQDRRWQEFMQFQINRTRDLYTAAWPSISNLRTWRGRLAVRAATLIYRDLLRAIEKNRYKVFTKRARVSTWRKLYLILVCLIHPPKNLKK